MHLFLKKIYRKNPFPKIYRINQCEVLSLFFGGTEVKTVNKFNELARGFWLGIMNKLTKEEARILANLMKDKSFTDKVKKIISSDRKKLLEEIKDDLSPSTWRKVVEDPELLDVWDRIRKRTCPFGGRNPPNGCEVLRKKIFADLDADQIKKWDADVESTKNAEFYDKFVGDNKLLDAWKVVEDLPAGKSWVRMKPNILEKINGLMDAQKPSFFAYYKSLKLPSDRPKAPPFTSKSKTIEVPRGNPKSIVVEYNEFGFPDFIPHAPKPGSFYKYKASNLNGGKLNGGGTDFGRANRRLAEQFGFSKNSDGTWPTNSDGFLETDKYRWTPGKQNFELKDAETGKWVKQTWHHHEDGQTLLPVPSRIHSTKEPGVTGFSHSGGKKVITLKPDLIGVFDSPNY